MNTDSGWIKCTDQMPPPNQVVETKIDDAKGCRNEVNLKWGGNRLWFSSDGNMYVYYEPTHWRPIEEEK